MIYCRCKRYVYRNCNLVDSLNDYIGPPNCVHYCGVVVKFEDVAQSLLNMILYDVWSMIFT
jgi:hypothetical protein